MDVYYQVKHRLQAPTLARKFDISHWFPSGADRRTYGQSITKISGMDRLPNFLRYGPLLKYHSKDSVVSFPWPLPSNL